MTNLTRRCRSILTAGVLLASCTHSACKADGGSASSPTGPTAISVDRASALTKGATQAEETGTVEINLPSDRSALVGGLASFPPRNEPYQFRGALESYYQNTLRRSPTQTAVDNEGAVVWTQEYLRYRLSGCAHLSAVSNVISQIDTGRIAPECGGSQGFPPRNEPFDFRANYLEDKYRNGLRRNLSISYVDIEGEIVWTTEYFRYRLSGCGHEDASQKTLAQVAGGAAPSTCQTLFAVFTSANQGWASIVVTVNGRSVGTLTRYLEPGTASSCNAIDGARVVAAVAAGTVTFSGRSDRGATWSGSRNLSNGQCSSVELTCSNRNCSAPAPTPTPTPTPPPTGGFYDGVVVTRVRGCNYFVADGPRGYFLLEWWSGYDPTVGDAFMGDVASYGFKDVLYNSARRPGRVWVDDYLLSRTRAAERLASKCR